VLQEAESIIVAQEKRIAELVAACELAGEMTGHNHWDHTMQHGSGCALCIRQREVMSVIRSAIGTTTPTAEIA